MVGVAAGFVGVAVLLYFTSAYFHAATSDSATIALEGQSVANGQLLLHGWDLTFASYWTSNALIDAAVVSFAGLGSAVLYAGPAVVGAVVVVAGAFLVREGRRLWAVVAGITAVVALLVCGVPAMEFFFVGHGFHVGTIAYALVAFAALRRTRAGWGWALAVVALAAGILGDLLMIAYGVMPIFLAGLLGARSQARPWTRTVEATAAAAGLALAGVARLVFIALGSFTAGSGLSFASPAQMLTNLGHVPAYGAGLLGLGSAVDTSGGLPAQLGAMHDLGLANAMAAAGRAGMPGGRPGQLAQAPASQAPGTGARR